MKTIIAPVDFSAVSLNACLYAAKMAKDIKAELILLHVAELPVAVTEFPVSEEMFDSLNMEVELKQLKGQLSAETNNEVNIQTKNIFGSIEYEIEQLCKIEKPFAVIMGTHSYNALDRFFVGSITLYSAKHLNNRVLVIPAGVKYKSIKKIALACDLKDIYEIPVDEIQSIIKCFNAELQIFYAGKNEKVIDKNAVTSVLLDHRLVRLNPQFLFVEDEDIMRGVTALAEKNTTDILIIIPKKHGPIHKSQSKDFMFYSSIPVMAIHEEDLVPQS